MSDIKLFVTHTPNRNTMRLDNKLLYNVIAGSDFQTKPVPEGVLLDNQGDNISSKNKSYCELTTQYWAWKNTKADYYGFCHYRRFFSFSKEPIEETCWGTVEYDFFNEKAKKETHFNEKDMQEYIEQYDFLIAKGVKTSCMQAESVYDHYNKAKELHIEDVEILLQIIKEKYPHLSETAKEFFDGDVFYPCNMFIMKKELFEEYSSMLFDILEEFEKRADMSQYSREGYRTTGHLGERLTGIFYLYLKKQNKYRLGELQIALIHNADEPDVVTDEPKENVVPIVLAANQKYVPILYTCAQSVVDHTSASHEYRIYIFHTDIDKISQDLFQQHLTRENVKIQFINVQSRVDGYILEAKEHITTETFYRFLILDILPMYEKVVYLDSDMIIRRDVADLYATEMGTNLIAAAKDPDFMGQCNGANPATKKYFDEVIKLDSPFDYFQAGVLVLNVKELNRVTSVRQLFEMSDTGIYKYSDQDILNVVCKNRVTYVDMGWNMLVDCNKERWQGVIKYAPYYILDAYEQARKDPYIIHYAGFLKPWMHPDEDFAHEFWMVARRTLFYEQIVSKMQNDYAWCISHDMIRDLRVKRKKGKYADRMEGLNFKGRTLERVRIVASKVVPRNSKLHKKGVETYLKITSR